MTKKTNASKILDDVKKNETLANLYVNNNQSQKSIECLENLLKLNSFNTDYYKEIIKA